MDRSAMEAERGRLVCVFGPPGAGCSTLIDVLARACETRTAILRPESGDLEEQVRAIRADVVFLDGYPYCHRDEKGIINGPEAVQYLYDRRLIFPGFGGLVRVAADPELSVRQGRATAGGIHAWFGALPAVEERVRLLNMPYFVVHNEPGPEGLETAVGELARRASIQR